MFVNSLRETYRRCKELGVCTSMQDFSVSVLGSSSPTYLSDLIQRSDIGVPRWIGPRVLYRLAEVQVRLTGPLVDEVDDIIEFVEDDVQRSNAYFRRY